MVAGIRTPQPISELEKWNPAVYNQLREITTMLEKHYRDMQDFEFTIQDGKLYMLQTRNGKRTGPAAVRIAVEMVEEGLIRRKKPCCASIRSSSISSCTRCSIPPPRRSLTKLATGLPASPGAAVGTVVFTADDAVEPVRQGARHPGPQRDRARRHSRHGSGQGHSHLARRHDQPRGRGLRAAWAPPASPAPSRSRSTSTRRKSRSRSNGKAITLKEGDWISLDGSTGEVFAGQANTIDADPTSGVLATLHELGRRVPRQLRRARQCRHPARRQGRPQVRRRRHRPVPHRAHVLRRGPHRAHAGHDSGARREDPPQGARRSCCPCSARISPACSKPWTASRW